MTTPNNIGIAKPPFQGVNWGLTISCGLVAAWPSFEGTGIASSEFAGTNCHAILDTAASWTKTPRGYGWKLGGTGSSDRVVTNFQFTQRINDKSISFACWVRPDALPNAYNTILHHGNSITFREFYIKSDGTLACYLARPGVAAFIDGAGFTCVAGDWHHLAFTYSNRWGLGTYVDGYVNQTLPADGGGDLAAINGATGSDRIEFGWDQTTTGRGLTGVIEAPMLWNRVLYGGEIRQLFQDHYTMFRRRRILKPSAAPPPANFSIVGPIGMAGAEY